MPAIKVYKGGGAMIPLEEAKIAKAYQCPWTSNLYATKAAYTKHLRDLRKSRMHRRAREIKHQKLLSQMWHQPDWQSVVDWVHLHGEVFFDIASRASMGNYGKVDHNIRADFKVTITYLQLNWTNSASNSHCRPVGGVTNWGTDKNKPKGYPGWQGRIEYKLSHERGFGFSSDCWKGTRLHTGSGGSCGTGVGYDVTLFAEDWPGPSLDQTMSILASDDASGRFTYGKSRR